MASLDLTAYVASVSSNPCYMRFRGMPIGQELDSRDAMVLFSCFEEQRIEQGTVIYEAGTSSEREMHIILEGQVSVSDVSGNIYATLTAGDVFGLFSFLEERPHSATIVAKQDVTALTITRPYFDAITCEDPLLGNQLLRFMFRLLTRMSLKLEVEYAALRDYALGARA